MTFSLEHNSISRHAIGISREWNNTSIERNIIARERSSISRERNKHDPSGAP